MSAIKGKCVLEQRRKYLFKVKELFDQGLYAAEIAREVDVPNQTIVNWVRKFNEGCDVNEMMRGKRQPRSAKNVRVTGVQAPITAHRSENTPVSESKNDDVTSHIEASERAETLEQKVARLERELRDSRMETALYKEIINVAEENFGIKITKKAGAKQ